MPDDPGILELIGGEVRLREDGAGVLLRIERGAVRRLRGRLDRLVDGDDLVLEPDGGPDLILEPARGATAELVGGGEDVIYLRLPASDVHGWRAELARAGRDRKIVLPCSGGTEVHIRVTDGKRKRRGRAGPPNIVYKEGDPAPGGVLAYKIYCGILGGIFLLCLIGAVIGMIMHEEMSGDDTENLIVMSVLAGMSLVATVLHLIPFALPRQPYAWTYGCVIIVVGLIGGILSCILCIAASIPVLIFFLKPEAKAWFHPPAAAPLDVFD